MRMKDQPSRPGVPPLSEADKNKVMHVALPILGGMQLMATDMLESMGQKLVEGNNFTINLGPDTKEEADRLYRELSGNQSSNGKSDKKLTNGIISGMIKLRYERLAWCITRYSELV